MTCKVWNSDIRTIKITVKNLDGDLNRLNRTVSAEFSQIASVLARIEARLDVLEQVAVDPDGTAAEALKDKYGLSKKASAPISLKTVKK